MKKAWRYTLMAAALVAGLHQTVPAQQPPPTFFYVSPSCPPLQPLRGRGRLLYTKQTGFGGGYDFDFPALAFPLALW